MSEVPTIVADITFLTTEEGGRRTAPDLSGCRYRPHLVAQTDTETVITGKDHLGVCSIEGPTESILRNPVRCILALMYHPQVDYSVLQPGAEFTIREGPYIVGFGTVVSRSEASNTQSS